jgi:DNA-binding XRE family transcriptional regulator
MVALTARIPDADRMMISARATADGISVEFADGCGGTVPYSAMPDIGAMRALKRIELPTPYEAILTLRTGATTEIPWDFARAYCDETYRPRVEGVAARGRQHIGSRIRERRRTAGMTQEHLARAARIGRVTLVRIEHGEQSPRHETLLALARAMKLDPGDLFAPGT